MVYYLQPIVSHTEVAVDGFLKKKKKRGCNKKRNRKAAVKNKKKIIAEGGEKTTCQSLWYSNRKVL